MSEQPTAPYLDAVAGYGVRGSGRFHVPGHKGGDGAAERISDERIEIRGFRLLAAGLALPCAHRLAARRSSARTKPSRSPSSTPWALPTSKFVRWSLTIVYGCST